MSKLLLSEAVKTMFSDVMARLLVGGTCEIRSGPMPTTASLPSLLPGRCLVRLALAWDPGTGSTKALAAPVLASGSAEWARLLDDHGDLLWIADVGGEDATIACNRTVLREGELFILEEFEFTQL